MRTDNPSGWSTCHECGRDVRIRPAPQPDEIERGERSCGGSAALLLAGLPIPREQIGDFVGGVIWKAGQHVSKPGLRIDVVHLASFDKGIDGGGTMAASI